MYKTIADIDGMSCGMCEAHVQDAIRKALDVQKVKANKGSGTLEIIAETAYDEADLKKVLDPTGYRVLSAASEPYEKKKRGFHLFG